MSLSLFESILVKEKTTLFDDDAKNVVDCEVLMAIPEVYGT